MSRLADVAFKLAHLRQWLLFRKLGPYTMVGHGRLYHLYALARELNRDGVPGSLVECGVWRGGAAAAMATADVRSGGARQVWLFDSFEGMPPPTEADGPEARAQFDRDRGATPAGAAERTLVGVAGIPRDRVHVVAGWFEQTLPRCAPEVGPVAMLRIDCDWYESTKACLESLYDRVVPGGVVLIDDYGSWRGSRKAVDEFLSSRGIVAPLLPAGDGAVYLRVPAQMGGASYWGTESMRYASPHLRLHRVAREVAVGPVLDIGCGPGALGLLLRDRGVAYDGVDIFQQELAYGRYRQFDLARDSLASFPFPGPYRSVTISGVLEYLPESRIHELLQLVATQLLAPGGTAVVTYTNFSHYSRSRRTFHERWVTTVRPGEMARWLADAGLELVRRYPSYYFVLGRRLSASPRLWLPLLSRCFGRQILYVLRAPAQPQ